MGRKTNLHLLPILVCCLTPATFFTTYAIAVKLNHVNPVFPYISDTGTVSPESCIFGLLLNINAVLLGICVFIKYKHIQFLVKRSELKVSDRLNKIASFFGYMSCLGLSMVGNFQAGRFRSLHFLGAFICFFGGDVYFVYQTIFSYHLRHKSQLLYKLRLILCCLGIILLVMAISFGVVARKHFHAKHSPRFWSRNDGGYNLHLVSVFSEWMLTFLQGALVLTFLPEFKNLAIHSPVLKVTASTSHGCVPTYSKAPTLEETDI